MNQLLWVHFLSVSFLSDERGWCWNEKWKDRSCMWQNCTNRESNPGQMLGRHLCYHYTIGAIHLFHNFMPHPNTPTYKYSVMHHTTHNHTNYHFTLTLQPLNLSTPHTSLWSLTQHFTYHYSINALPCITKVIILYQTNNLHQCLCHFVHSSFILLSIQPTQNYPSCSSCWSKFDQFLHKHQDLGSQYCLLDIQLFLNALLATWSSHGQLLLGAGCVQINGIW